MLDVEILFLKQQYHLCMYIDLCICCVCNICTYVCLLLMMVNPGWAIDSCGTY